MYSLQGLVHDWTSLGFSDNPGIGKPLGFYGTFFQAFLEKSHGIFSLDGKSYKKTPLVQNILAGPGARNVNPWLEVIDDPDLANGFIFG